MATYRPMRLAPRTKGELMKTFLQGLSVRDAAEEVAVNKNTAYLHFQRWRSLLVRAEQVRWTKWAASMVLADPFQKAEFQILVNGLDARMGSTPLLGVWNTGKELLCHFLDKDEMVELPGGVLPEAMVWDPHPVGDSLTPKRLLCLTMVQIRDLAWDPGRQMPQEISHPYWIFLLEKAIHIKIIPNAHLEDVVQEFAWRFRFPDWNEQLLELRKLARLEATLLTKIVKKESPAKKNAEVYLEAGGVRGSW